MMLRLAGHLGKTLREIRSMSSTEFSLWMAWHLYFEPIGGAWEQTGTMAAAMLAPYCPKGKTPEPADFIPKVKSTPKHPTQMRDVLAQMKADIERR